MSLQPFGYSELPARWGPSAGAILLVLLQVVVGHIALEGPSVALALAIDLAGIAAIGAAGRALARKGTSGIRLMRSESANLIATRHGTRRSEPRIWLVAHIDSKSQTIPMLVRVGSVAVFSVCLIVLLGVLVPAAITELVDVSARTRETAHDLLHVVHPLLLLAVISLLPVIFCFIGNKSDGALDNATGLASVLLAAEILRDNDHVAVLITSAEELGLAGARAFAAAAQPAVAINCDTIDDSGEFMFMASGASSSRLDDAIDAAATRLGIRGKRSSSRRRARKRLAPMIPGILADNIALTEAGWEAFTLSRGNLGTLARVHTSRDRTAAIDGTGAAQAANLIAAIVEELT